MARTFLVLPLAVVAACVAGALLLGDIRNLADVFALADPTGAFGFYLHVGGVAANLAVILMALCVLLPRLRAEFRTGFAVVAFVPSLLEAIAALPCFITAHPRALCGVGMVLVTWWAIPITIAAAIGFVATARQRRAKFAGVALAAAFVGMTAAAQTVLAPRDPGQCRAFAEVTKRSTCLKVFATRADDAELCRTIEFRTTRFACLHDVAVAKKNVKLCEEIRDTGPIQVFEAPAVTYRDACFQNLAYALHDHGGCAKIENQELRAGCEHGVP